MRPEDEARAAGEAEVAMSMRVTGLGALALLMGLSACGLNRETVLPGERLDLRAVTDAPVLPPEGARAISLGAPVALASWTHTSATPEHRAPHAALSGTTLQWAAPIGQGDTRRHRITATPVVAGGRVYTLDALAGVMAHDVSGRPLWRADLTPAGERATDASGGGLAYGDGVLYVTTAFGELAALDAASGERRWVQRLGAAATGTPTVRGGLVYAVSRDGVGWAVETGTGKIAWQLAGLADASGVVGPAGPAVSDALAVFPFGSGELLAARRVGGSAAWRSAVTGERTGAAYRDFTDVTGDPVFADGRLYAGNATGRVVALDLGSGARLWTADEGAMGPVWPAGGSLFLVSDASEVVRLDAADGRVIWASELPGFTQSRPRRRKAVHAHHGPVVAGGRVVVASSDGLLRLFDPVDGALTSAVQIPGGASTAPVVAGGTLYVVSRDGRLLAYR